MAGILEKGVGIELAKKRWEFAEKWKFDENFNRVTNINENFADVKLEKNKFDFFICIDNTFTYLGPENNKYPELMLKKLLVH